MGIALVDLGGLCEADLLAMGDVRLARLLRAALGQDAGAWQDSPAWSSFISVERQ